MARLRPSWQSAECPTWCTREHEESDRDGDRDHQSEAVCFPVVHLIRESSEGYARYAQADDALAMLYQGEHDVRPWLSIGLAEYRTKNLELSPESAERLMAAARMLVAVAHEPHGL